MHWVKRGRALSSCWKLGFSGVSAAYKCKHFFSIEMGKSQRTWGGLEPTRWPSSWCAYLWWSNNQPDEPSVSLGTPVSWKTGERQMFSTTEQSQAVIHSTNPAHDFLVIWQPPERNAELLPLSPTVELALAAVTQPGLRGDSPDCSRKTLCRYVTAGRGCSGMCGEGCGMLLLGWGEYWFRHPRTMKILAVVSQRLVRQIEG